jgi:hypothetical protein
MLRGRVADVVAVSALATIVTAVIAAPVLRSPAERVFGMEIVGRHHDPFSVMAQFERPITINAYSQPVTDIIGALIARITGPVAAYTWLVLLTFPLSAAAAYLLARHLTLSRIGATVAAMAYAFSPFHIAQAAYHPQVAQTQWIPLYLLALWGCLDDASPAAVAFLAIATTCVTLSNFYGGLIAAVVTPVAASAYWFARARTVDLALRHLIVTAGALAVLAGVGLAYVWWTARSVLADPSALAFASGDVFRYSAKWWSYLVPPVAHPLLGERVRQMWTAAGVSDGLLEQQVGLGWGVVALAAFAVYRWFVRDRRAAAVASIPVLAAVAATALLCSLSPERTIGAFRFVRPSAALHELLPMFRAYARFGVVVQLMAALLAGIGVDYLRRSGTWRARVACVALVTLVVGEYAVSPSAMWRDVLPTAAHRWVVEQPGPMRVLDCTPGLGPEAESVEWLTRYRVTLLGGAFSDCAEPDLPGKLAANGFTHLLIRAGTPDDDWFAGRRSPSGLRIAARFNDGQVLAVTARTPAILTTLMTGFSPRERNAEWTWRWMGTDAFWTITNTLETPVIATLDVELSAFARARHLELRFDTLPVDGLETLVVTSARGTYRVGSLVVPPGDHQLLFHPIEAPDVAADVLGNGDARPLSFAVGTWRWDTPEERP